MPQVTFRAPELGDHAQMVQAQRELARDGFIFAFDFTPEVDFAHWLERLKERRHGRGLPPGHVASTFELALVGDQIAGRLSVRHTLNEQLLVKGGHIGYGVLPEFRRRGIGGQLLQRGLQITASLGLNRVLVTCDNDNVASCRIIEGAGGMLESTVVAQEGDVPTRRYWLG